MFWKKQSKSPDMLAHRNSCNQMASAALSATNVEFNAASKLEQALLGTFIFGMLQAHGMANGLTPAELHAIGLCVFKDTLCYTDSAAAEGMQECINATAPSYHPTMNAIIHRGIDGHKQYINGDSQGLAQNISEILNQFRKS